MRRLFRLIFECFTALFNYFILPFIVSAVGWWFFGTVTVTAQIDDLENVEGAIVEIDGKYVGDTPVTTWLIPGRHTVTVIVDGIDTTESEVTWHLFGTPWSTELNAEFTSLYK